MKVRNFGIGSSIVISAAVISAPPARPAQSLFRCSFGTKEVSVRTDGSQLIYAFGTPKRVEMSIVSDAARGNVHYLIDRFPHSANSQLRFQNGEFSYVLFNRFSTPSYNGKGAEDRSGLVVLKGKQVINRIACKSGPGFSQDYDFDKLTVDSDDYSVF